MNSLFLLFSGLMSEDEIIDLLKEMEKEPISFEDKFNFLEILSS